ncbi:glutaredoxin-like protein NrdH [Ketogulonicigenium vulgare]|uniref:Glutaredoxin-like protein NrdH n=1 Tax=Ketogulonicigenium vulgare (strain WSH-001) TaxID=759362 RepID=F9Y6I4_KETVW|nr:glutaredoxin-like protein NrdH [Ketogulonicigenium vulgare]ADO42743.1 Glutaredoxin [Ketogulonicigenium vulgare Y25]AEM40930.1 Ribonucleoside-diphosphate reductase class Ib glutaredoxin subunit [Ketogulonicigenium vulgare WSH-001]ALJ81084.1 NrdH-redoxin [Ketogulonicigenium vulgare]ANW35040.1 NrdH-redoxin [Ketogulonicigenium vulgare]AOZ54655.1 glutaredoxin [Ketogulonicigenium vulgare]
MSIMIYSKPGCVQCTATARAMDARDISFEMVDVTVDANAFAAVEALGYRQLPVVVADDQHWSGFRPDRIAALA